jgi:D-cysteine desulfhydrase family pyridoxal phosphate-dependent enzyme
MNIAEIPTPVHPLPGVSRVLGINLCVKRDDLTGLALGGNKARKLQRLATAALDQRADVLVTGGGVQSNHVRQTAAAAASIGMDAHIVLGGANDAELVAPSGNVLLDVVLGATIEMLPTDDYGAIEHAIVAAARTLQAEGRNPYAIPVGGASPLGVQAYEDAAGELLAQQPDVDVVFVADGSGGTHAGLLRGFEHNGPRIVGVDVGTRPDLEAAIRAMAGIDAAITVDSDHVGPGYGELDDATVEAIRMAARGDGILLDPVYTGKAFAALISWVRSGRIGPEEKVCFWHTGGQPALFAEKYRGAFAS